jgi:hypothetical protein
MGKHYIVELSFSALKLLKIYMLNDIPLNFSINFFEI